MARPGLVGLDCNRRCQCAVCAAVAAGVDSAPGPGSGAGRCAGGRPVFSAVDFIRNGETGFRVPVRDPEAMEAALCKLCDDPKAAEEMGQRGEQLIRDRYNWKSVVEKISFRIRQVIKDEAEKAKP